MVLFSLTVNIDKQIEEDWLEWMRESFVPNLWLTGYFQEKRFLRLLNETENDGVTYSLQLTVLNLNRAKEFEVAIGGLKTTIKPNRLEKISKNVFNKLTAEEPTPKAMKGIDLNEKMMNFSFNLDIRGKRGEIALQEVDGFLDDAIILGYPELRIVHGKGDGILRMLIRNHLKGYKQVNKIVDEHADRGGAGVTIVTMK